MAIIPCVTPRRMYTLHQQDYDYWRVYCHNTNVSPRPQRHAARAFTIQDAKKDVQSSHHQQHPKIHTLSKHGPNRTVSQTQLVGAEELQFV